MKKTFKSSIDFRKSLESRLFAMSYKSGEDLQRIRRKMAFDRFLARVFYKENPLFLLKGGYAMELRIARARSTKDIDLTYLHNFKNAENILSELIFDDLQQIANIDLHDFFSYQIGLSQKDLVNAPYGGFRYPILSLIANKSFVKFHIDIALDVTPDYTENIKGFDWLEFCGINAPNILIVSVPQQFAEKLHAYTLPNRNNSRTKDLIDLILLLNIKKTNIKEFRSALEKVFKIRNTHVLPSHLESPPNTWEKQFSYMAKECSININMQEAFNKISIFYNEIMNPVII